MTRRAAIIGGGITGLAAAWEFQSNPDLAGWEVTLFESSPRLGGKVQTSLEDGFLMEWGPDSFITQKPEALTLCKELGLENELISCQPFTRPVYVAHQGKLHALPEGFRLLTPMQLTSFFRSDLFSLRGKLRAMCEPVIPAKKHDGDESISDFVTRRMGREVLERVAGPMLAGIYNGHPDELSIQSTFPQLCEMERTYGSLKKGFAQRKAAKDAAPLFMTLKRGMVQLAESLADQLRCRIHCDTPVPSLSFENQQWSILDDSFDRVIVTTPAQATSRLLASAAPELSALLSSLTSRSMMSISMGFKTSQRIRPDELNGYGLLTSLTPNRTLTACTWSSSKFPGRAPRDHETVRVFLSAEPTEDSDQTWVERARTHLNPYMMWEGDPIQSRVTRLPQSSPQYLLGHQDKLQQIQSLVEATPSLQLAGCSLYGVGLSDCIRQGRAAAHNCNF